MGLLGARAPERRVHAPTTLRPVISGRASHARPAAHPPARRPAAATPRLPPQILRKYIYGGHVGEYMEEMMVRGRGWRVVCLRDGFVCGA